jgi:hypothetical protein
MTHESIDLSPTIVPKSDQLNADDLITGPITIKVVAVKGSADPQQPVAIHYEGDNGKPYKPCKSMRRLLVAIWGANGGEYVGRSITLHLDPAVMFGGIAVGGIRISHLSHIDGPKTIALTASKTSRKPFTVKPLTVAAPAQIDTAPALAAIAQAENIDALGKVWAGLSGAVKTADGVAEAKDRRKGELATETTTQP